MTKNKTKAKPGRVNFSFTPLMQPSTGFVVEYGDRWLGTVARPSGDQWHAYPARAGLEIPQSFLAREDAALALLSAMK